MQEDVPLFPGSWLPLVLLWQALGLFPLRHLAVETGRRGWARSRPLQMTSVLGLAINGLILSEVLTRTLLDDEPVSGSNSTSLFVATKMGQHLPPS